MTYPRTILGIDASSTNLGWCVYDIEQERVIAHGSQKLGASRWIGQRCQTARGVLGYLLTTYTPDAIGYEGPAYKASPLAIIAQQRVVGVLLMLAADVNREPIEIPPTTAKKALTGSGRADKDLMMQYAEAYIPAGCDEHEADALGVALAALGKIREQELARKAA